MFWRFKLIYFYQFIRLLIPYQQAHNSCAAKSSRRRLLYFSQFYFRRLRKKMIYKNIDISRSAWQPKKTIRRMSLVTRYRDLVMVPQGFMTEHTDDNFVCRATNQLFCRPIRPIVDWVLFIQFDGREQFTVIYHTQKNIQSYLSTIRIT